MRMVVMMRTITMMMMRMMMMMMIPQKCLQISPLKLTSMSTGIKKFRNTNDNLKVLEDSSFNFVCVKDIVPVNNYIRS